MADRPDAAQARYTITASNPSGVLTRVRSRRHTIDVDEPEALGGDDAATSPVEYALVALASCQVATYRFTAARLGIRLDDIDVSAEADLDARGFFGLDPQVRPGFTAVRFHVAVTGPESTERYEELRREVDAHCPVLDLFSNPTPVSNTFSTSSD